MEEFDLKGKNILIVEDSRTQALLLQESLEKNQFIVRVAQDGLDGMQKIEEKLPDLIISDIEMPRMNGYEFCKHIKKEEKYKYIPIILLTSLIDPLDVIKGLDCGANSFLSKPCDITLLCSTIQNSFKNIPLINEHQKEKLSFFFDGKSHTLEVNQVQITELLLSTYANAIQKNKELDEAYHKLNQVYEELERNNNKLKELNEQKNQLLGMAAHDLKNPLAVISGLSHFLLNATKDSIDEEKSHQMIKKINDSSVYMIGVIDNFLDFSTIESGTLTLHLSEVDLPELIQKDLFLFESIAQKKEIKIVFNHKDPIPKVRCDSSKISQVINNLISNGIKFTNPQGTLEISFNSSPTEVTVSVKDSGVGMSQESLAKLFQPFTKMKTKGTAGEKGSGLGLAIAHKVVTALKGKIWAESQLGVGTTFYVSIPY